MWEAFNEGDSLGRKGYANYELTNNNANIKRITNRIKEMERESARTTEERTIKGVRFVKNAEANRVQLIFPGIPAEDVRKKLKSRGFKWSHSEGAWQRFLNNSGIYDAENFLENYDPGAVKSSGAPTNLAGNEDTLLTDGEASFSA